MVSIKAKKTMIKIQLIIIKVLIQMIIIQKEQMHQVLHKISINMVFNLHL
jgi:hypothetical protein